MQAPTFDEACVSFLQWALPRLGLRWRGYRRVRRQVGKRLGRRLKTLTLPDLTAYREHLESHASEWRWLEGACRITISRFYRDRRLFDLLTNDVLASLARLARDQGHGALLVWSAGCGSGEEPYTLNVAWKLVHEARGPQGPLRILATDSSQVLLDRARRAVYPRSSLKDLPQEWREAAFHVSPEGFVLDPFFRENVEFLRQDLRLSMPKGPFHLVLCRNLAFTYFDEALQRKILQGLSQRLLPGGFLVVGIHEKLPSETWGLRPIEGTTALFRKAGREESAPIP